MPAPTIDHGVAYANVVGDGVTDDYSSILMALQSGAKAVFIPPLVCRVSQGLTIPAGVEMYSVGFEPSNPPTGCVLLFDLAVSTCVAMGGGTDLSARSLRGIIVSRATGTIPVGSVGVSVNGGYNIQLDQVMSLRHEVGYKFKSTSQNGISAHCARLFTGTITKYHISIDSWPELYIASSRFGMNSGGDRASTAFIHITGGGTAGSGPNTLDFVQCQFNQGVVKVASFMKFEALIGEDSNALEYKFTDCHIENLSQAVLISDSETSKINRMQMSNCLFNVPNVPFFLLAQETTLSDFQASNVLFYSSTFNITPSSQVDFLQISNGRMLGSSRIVLASNSTASFVNVSFGGLCEVGGAGNVSFTNPEFLGGIAFLAGRTSFVSIIGLDPQNISLGLAFGGNSTGISYLYSGATWQFSGSRVEIDFRLLLSSKGTSMGAATLTGLPVRVDALRQGSAGGGLVNYALNMVGLSGSIMLEASAGDVIMNIYQNSPTGIATVTDANFLNNGILYGSVSYIF